MARKRLPEYHPGFPIRVRKGHHHEVQSFESILILPEALADQPLQSVPARRASDPLLRHRETEAGRARAACPGKDREEPIGRADRVFEYPPEVAPRAEPPFTPERTVGTQRQKLTKSGVPDPSPAVP